MNGCSQREFDEMRERQLYPNVPNDYSTGPRPTSSAKSPNRVASTDHELIVKHAVLDAFSDTSKGERRVGTPSDIVSRDSFVSSEDGRNNNRIGAGMRKGKNAEKSKRFGRKKEKNQHISGKQAVPLLYFDQRAFRRSKKGYI